MRLRVIGEANPLYGSNYIERSAGTYIYPVKKATDRVVAIDVFRGMEADPKTADGRGDEDSGGVDPQKEAAHWREQHPKQPYAKEGSYEQFEHAYKIGYNSFLKHHPKNFDEVEESVANDYENGKPDSALPWDTVRPAVNSVWERMSGIVSPRDPSRGVRYD